MLAHAQPNRPSRPVRTTPTVELLGSVAALERLRPEWIYLWAVAAGAGPFQHPAWLLPWARTHAPDRTCAVAVRAAGELVGLLPVFNWRGALYLAGTGPSDHGDGLFAPAWRDAAAEALNIACREAVRRDCETIDLRQLPPGSPLLTADAPAGWTSQVTPGDACLVAPILGADGVGAMPGKWRRKLGYTRRKAEDLGGWRVEQAAPETAPLLLGELERLHAARWSERGEPGVLDQPLTRALLDAALPELARDGLLHLYALHAGDTLAGAVMALEARRSLCFYACGFDPALKAYGPGTLLIAHALGEAARAGARSADFLRGGETYKQHWGAVAEPRLRRVLTRT